MVRGVPALYGLIWILASQRVVCYTEVAQCDLTDAGRAAYDAGACCFLDDADAPCPKYTVDNKKAILAAGHEVLTRLSSRAAIWKRSTGSGTPDKRTPKEGGSICAVHDDCEKITCDKDDLGRKMEKNCNDEGWCECVVVPVCEDGEERECRGDGRYCTCIKSPCKANIFQWLDGKSLWASIELYRGDKLIATHVDDKAGDWRRTITIPKDESKLADDFAVELQDPILHFKAGRHSWTAADLGGEGELPRCERRPLDEESEDNTQHGFREVVCYWECPVSE